MRWMRRASILLFFAVLSLPAPALAITIAPPGKAGADQYFETIPSSGGSVAPPSSGGPKHAGGLTGAAKAGAARLAHLGSDGQAAAALATATAPVGGAGKHGSAPAGAGAAAQAAAGQGGSDAGAVSRVLTGSDDGGLGPLLPVLLASGLIAALGLVAARLRRRSPPEIGA